MPRPNHYLLIILDSCRFDSFVVANPRTIQRLGALQRRWSWASWTSPSHYNLLTGLLPHSSPRHVFASEYYKRDFARYAERLGVEGVAFKDLLPSLWLPTLLRRLGYQTHALVSLPVLNPATPLAHDFDSYTLMPTHNDMAAMLARLRFAEAPTFHLLNVGETHYPFALPSEDPSTWPRLSGVHGTLQRLDEAGAASPPPFDAAQLAALRDRQIAAVRYLDGVFERLFDQLPPQTYVTVTADHGELFGEDGYVGHGPIQHDKVFEVPFLEGRLR